MQPAPGEGKSAGPQSRRLRVAAPFQQLPICRVPRIHPVSNPFPGGPTIPDKTGTACYLTGIQWATNVQSNVYWSSSTNTANPSDAWAWDLFSREVNGGAKTLCGPCA